MRAAVLTGPRSFQIETLRVPLPTANEVCIRLEGCGVCASNVPTWTGMPWTQYPTEPGGLGHEGWGIVDEVGQSVAGIASGDRVAIISNHAYAEFDVVSQDAAVKLPPALDGEEF